MADENNIEDSLSDFERSVNHYKTKQTIVNAHKINCASRVALAYLYNSIQIVGMTDDDNFLKFIELSDLASDNLNNQKEKPYRDAIIKRKNQLTDCIAHGVDYMVDRDRVAF